MDSQSYYDLQILNQLEEAPNLTQRLAAEKLGVSVKLAHSVIKGLIRRGLVNAKPRDGRSLSYLLTPAGISEKVRLTYEFMNFSTQFFREARRRSSEICRRLVAGGVGRVAFLGAGDLAEISYLAIREHSLKLVSVYGTPVGSRFLDLPVKPVNELPAAGQGTFDRILVTAFDPAFPARANYLPEGVTADERFVWIFDHDDMVREISRQILPEDGGSQ